MDAPDQVPTTSNDKLMEEMQDRWVDLCKFGQKVAAALEKVRKIPKLRDGLQAKSRAPGMAPEIWPETAKLSSAICQAELPDLQDEWWEKAKLWYKELKRVSDKLSVEENERRARIERWIEELETN